MDSTQSVQPAPWRGRSIPSRPVAVPVDRDARRVTVVLSGASDDLIELDGAIVEEFTSMGGDRNLVAFSDGTVLRIVFNVDGVWRITPVARGSASLSIDQAPEDDEDNYSDKATLTGDITWAVHGVASTMAKG